MAQKKIGVVLFQLGGPDSLDAIEPFLYNLFCDPDIIDFPFARIARQPLAKLISSRRARHVAHHYAEIGGKSPILEFTRRQAEALERELRREFDARVVMAMRYWRPFTQEAIATLAAHTPDEVVLLPLYPQYSKTTTGSSLNEWNRHFRKNGVPVHVIDDFHDYPPYIAAQVERVNEALAKFPAGEPVELVFSAHGTPANLAEKGDPYAPQV